MILFTQKSVAYRIWLSLSILALLIAVLGFFASTSLKSVGSYSEEIYFKPLQTINFARLTQSDFLRLEIAYATAVNSPPQSQLRIEFRDNLKEAIFDLEDYLGIINERALSEEVKSTAKIIGEQLFELEKLLFESSGATEVSLEIQIIQLKLEEGIEHVVETTAADGYEFIQTVNTEISDQIFFVNSLVVGSIFIAVTISYLLGRGQIIRLKSIASSLIALSKGDDNIDIPDTDRIDEFGDMARAAEAFQRSSIAYQKKIEELAYSDSLTGLPNRNVFEDRLNQLIKTSKRNGQKFMVALLDLDKFKPINDNLGHMAGDLVLQEVSTRLACVIRGADTVARIGGDEFVLLLGDQKAINNVEGFSKRIISAIKEPIDALGEEVNVGISLGLSIYPDHGNEADELIKKADEAMYYAKTNKVGWKVFSYV
ncbi:MAG: GGDEF domain-containing protein [Kordiimonadaceae bacterium]|nr:GGDEF domain-containing protein [Kordiimonadaceae bacterium]